MINLFIKKEANRNHLKYTLRCCWHSVHSGSNSWASGIASCTTNVDCTAKQRVQLIKLLRCKNWSASSKPCWHMSDITSDRGGNKIRIKRLMFCLDSSMLVFDKFTCFQHFFERKKVFFFIKILNLSQVPQLRTLTTYVK